MTRRRLLQGAAVLVVLALAGAGGVWALVSPEETVKPAIEPVDVVATTSLQEQPVSTLRIELRGIGGVGVGRVRRGRLRGPARAIRDRLAEFVLAAFVDPERWDGGRFPELERFFSPEARRRARRDAGALTLGPLASDLVAVQPRSAVVRVRFLVGRSGGAAAAEATLDFRGTGVGESLRVPIRHRGRYVLRRLRGDWRIVSYDVEARASASSGKAAKARFTPPISGRRPKFFLVIGSDARPGQSVARLRADSLHIVGIDTRRRRASVLGIPRDSYVPIPGLGTRKINEALYHGGPALQVRTVEQLSGIKMDGYLLTGFRGFQSLVSRVGGIKVRIPYAMSDRASGAFFRPGVKRLHGKQALAFSRNRYDAPGGDFGRSMNQGRLMVAALREFRSDLRREGAIVLFRWIAAGMRSVKTDLGLGDAIDLLLAATTIDPSRVKNDVVSGSGAMVGGASVVRLGPGAFAMFRDLGRDGVLGGR